MQVRQLHHPACVNGTTEGGSADSHLVAGDACSRWDMNLPAGENSSALAANFTFRQGRPMVNDIRRQCVRKGRWIANNGRQSSGCCESSRTFSVPATSRVLLLVCSQTRGSLGISTHAEVDKEREPNDRRAAISAEAWSVACSAGRSFKAQKQKWTLTDSPLVVGYV